MPASRKQEAEADYIGFMIMAQGCYKPHAAIDFWARMKIEAQGPPQILSTHPSHCNREKKLREWLPKAIEKAEASECFGTHRLGMLFYPWAPSSSHQLLFHSLLVLSLTRF